MDHMCIYKDIKLAIVSAYQEQYNFPLEIFHEPHDHEMSKQSFILNPWWSFAIHMFS